MIRPKNRLVEVFPVILLAILFIFLSVWRVRVGLMRFFDVDEFSYLHWAANVARGGLPYRDFFLMVPPGFFWVFGLVVAFAGVGPQVFVAGRIVTLMIFFVMCGLVASLFGMTRGWRWAILAAAIFAFLPMPYDKFLEIRPDNLATMLAMAGLVLETTILTGAIRRVLPGWVLVGFFYAASLLVLPKMLPFAVVGIGVLGLSKFLKGLKSLKSLKEEGQKDLFPLLIGFFGPFVLFFLWLATTDSFSMAWYSVTRLPFELYLSTPWAPMEPNLFFYPNSSFYGGTGHEMTAGFIVNHALWLLAIGVGAYRACTLFLTSLKYKTNPWAEALIAGTFVLSVIGYVKFFPLRHAQYLIPIAIFVAYYAADGLSVFFDWLAHVGGGESLAIVVIGLVYLLVASANQTYTPKLGATNTQQLKSIDRLLSVVPATDRVLDLEGRMLFWQDAYYICCVPFGTFVPYMSRPPEPLVGILERTRVPYIFLGDSGRMGTFVGQEYEYILTHYQPAAGWGESLWVRK